MRNSIIITCLLLVSVFAKAQQLQSYIQEAILSSPEIQAYNLLYDIAEEKVKEADWIPNAEFGVGYFVSKPETRTGAQRAKFSARQMLPWFGTITARESYASSMADAEYVGVVIAKRKLSLSVAQSYYRLYAIKAKQKVLYENIQLLKTYEKLALTSVEVGKASAVDVLRLQIRQNELQQQMDVLGEGYLGEQAAFNRLLNRDGAIAVDVLEELLLPIQDSLLPQDNLALNPGLVELNTELLKLNRELLKLNPELVKYDKLYESIVQSESLNQSEGNPMVGFGLDYVPVSERPDMSFSDNGKDIFMPMVSVSIPLFNRRHKSVSKQNELQQLVIASQKDNRLNVLESAFAKAISQCNQARIKYYTQEKNLKQASDAEEILIKNYETGTIDFNDLLDIQELKLRFQSNQIGALATYYAQSAVVNYLIAQ